MTYRNVAFDLDGTLLDTLVDLHLSVNQALEANGMPARTKDEVRLATGNGIATLIARSVPAGCPAELCEKALSDFKAYYDVHAMDHLVPYEGIPELLCALREKGMGLAVVSNKADFAVQKIISAKLPGMFDAVIGENEAAGIAKKPAPDMVDAALSSMGCDREGLVYVGDSEVDIQTAANLGCSCLACTWGFRDREWLAQNGATTILDTPAELARILLD